MDSSDNEMVDACCQLCGRRVPLLTRHHLIPRSLHSKKSIRRRYSKDTLLNALLMVCRPCHNAIHMAKSEQELAKSYARKEMLLTIPEVKEFVRWLSEKPAEFVSKKTLKKKR